MKVLPIALALLCFAAAAFASDEEAVLALDHEMAVATWTADTEWFERNLADDFVLITASGRLRTKAEAVSELATPTLTMQPYEPTEQQVRISGTTAIVTGRVWQRYTVQNHRYEADMRYTNVWVKKKGKWALMSTHASAIAKKR